MKILFETERLIIRQLEYSDAPFILRLLNDPAFIRNIADRGVRTIAQAEQYLRCGPRRSYRQNGFGLSAVVETNTGTTIGICGLIKRYYLEFPDLGYAFLPEYRRSGFAIEAASGTLNWGKKTFPVQTVLALVNPDNAPSISLLKKMQFHEKNPFVIPGEAKPVLLFEKAGI